MRATCFASPLRREATRRPPTRRRSASGNEAKSSDERRADPTRAPPEPQLAAQTIEPLMSLMMDISEQLSMLSELKRWMGHVDESFQRIEVAISFQGGAMAEMVHQVSQTHHDINTDAAGSIRSQLSSDGSPSKPVRRLSNHSITSPPRPPLPPSRPGSPPPVDLPLVPAASSDPHDAFNLQQPSLPSLCSAQKAQMLGLPSRGDQRKSTNNSNASAASARSIRSVDPGTTSRAFDQFMAARGKVTSQYGMMEELEAHMGNKLLQRPHRHLRRGKGTTALCQPQEASQNRAVSRGSQDSPGESLSAKRVPSRGRVPTVTGKPGSGFTDKKDMKDFMSLDALQNHHNAALVSTPADKRRIRDPAKVAPLELLPAPSPSQPVKTTGASGSSLSTEAWISLCLMGLLDWRKGLLWQMVAIFSHVVFPLTMASGILSLILWRHPESLYDPTTMGCFVLGCVAATVALRRSGVTSLLGPTEYGLDDYAKEVGFLSDWQKVSRRHFWGVLCTLFVSCGIRIFHVIMEFPSTGPLGDISPILSVLMFVGACGRFAVTCYSLMHICCGMELAIDSFALRFFKDMDYEQAVEEWNEVQATLRQVSTKLSDSFIALGGACLGALLLFAEQAIRDPEELKLGAQSALWIGWLYPPFLLLLYALMRAAAVSEKASRVAPLVNSWQFQDSEGVDEPAVWMDHDRQYVVQYIIQSEAGFYMKGVRVNAFSVQKLGYYLAAVTFGLLSRLL